MSGYYEPHRHTSDQLCWFPDGWMDVSVGGERWIVQSDGAVWLPAGVLHEMRMLGEGHSCNLYADPALRPRGQRWAGPLTIRLDPLARAVLRHLGADAIADERRQACHRLLSSLLADAVEDRAAVPLPRDPRARRIAERILTDPADPHELRDWAETIGVSTRTLMRSFANETGYTFGEWRVRVRMLAALSLLAQGQPVHAVADAVGYRTSSGFIEAFRRTFGTTPSAYRRSVG